jgi:hypothetical protein
MPPTKGSRAAHEGAIKAAATRKRNKLQGGASKTAVYDYVRKHGYPKGYKAPVTQKLPQTVALEHPRSATKLEKGGRRVPVHTAATRKRASVKKMSTQELIDEFEYQRSPTYSATRRTMNEKQRERDSMRYYRIKDELNDRYSVQRTGKTLSQLGREYSKAEKSKRSAKKKNPATHRKDLLGAHRRLMNAYDMARTPVAKRKILARAKRIEAEMDRREV